MRTIEERFWEKVDKTPNPKGCWEWIAAKSNSGYGMFTLTSGRMVKAHRFVYELVCGKIPQDKCILHTCDNRKCVNPKHLFVGSQLDNSIDMVKKFRGINKLTINQISKIIELRDQKYTLRFIANLFPVTESEISRICSGVRWGHLTLD